MQDKLIGYLLNALEVNESALVEQMLEVDSEARRQLQVLRLGLIPLDGDRKHAQAPDGLAVRTCQLIRERESDKTAPPGLGS